MNNTKTRFVIAITQKLSAAPDSAAKVDLIEELSENLCGRYQDMVAAGMPDEEAYQKAMSELGDVEELLAYLGGFGGTRETPPAGNGNGQWGFEENGEFNEIMRSAMGIARQAVGQAKEAILDAKAMAQEGMSVVQDAMRDMDGQIIINTGKSSRRVAVNTEDDDVTLPQEGLRGVCVAVSGDVTVFTDPNPESPVRLQGDTSQLLLDINDNGILTIRQNKQTASGSFFFSRGLFSADVELTLPRRPWDALEISTASGDVEINPDVEIEALTIQTASGDISVPNSIKVSRMSVKTASGSLELYNNEMDELVFTSASGDLELDGVSCCVKATTASGDIELRGSFPVVRCATASGDVSLHNDIFPQALDIKSKSGDCEAAIPDGTAFTLQFHTVSGELSSGFELNGPLGTRSGQATYMGGGEHTFHMVSISGDLQLCVQH